MINVIKRRGHSEAFNETKLTASLYATCLSAHIKPDRAKTIANKVTSEVAKWLANKTEITTNDIRREAGKLLSEQEPHAGYWYLNHRII
jgi:transcriptional regulator NrdR family protein